MSWEKYKPEIESYINDSEDLVIHIIKTGFTDMYIVTYDDPYKINLGRLDILSSTAIKQEYGIEVQI